MAEKDLNVYFTGVTTDGDAQGNPNSSLGGKRSGTTVESLSATALVNVTGVVINQISANSGEGSATLAFLLTGLTLAYTAPGDTVGAAVDVSTDGTFEIYSNDATKYLVVTVTNASLPSADQSDSISMTTKMENLFDSVGSGEALAGDTEYRALIIKNDSASTMNALIVWIATNTPFVDDTVTIAIEATVSNAIQTIADEKTAPTGLTFLTAVDEANGLLIGNLASGASYGFWIKRVVTATTQRYPGNSFSITFKADTV